MDLRISEDELKAWLACEFCGQTAEWPYSSTTLAPGNDPDIDLGVNHILSCHYSTPKNLDELDFDECSNVGRWKQTTWRRIDVDNEDKVVMQGPMRMENGFPSAKKK